MNLGPVFNADEIGYIFKFEPNKTNTYSGEKYNGSMQQKERLFCLPAMLLFGLLKYWVSFFI
jgi:hypothetical protein